MMVQFDHCVLAMSTYLMTALLFVPRRHATLRAALPRATLRAMGGRVRDGEHAGGAWYLHTPLPRTCTARRYASSWQGHAFLGYASCRPCAMPTRCRYVGVAAGEFS